MSFRFDGQVVAVSGAGHGIGRAIALGFAGSGARVFACDLLAEELSVLPETIRWQALDLRDRAGAHAWIGAVEADAGKPLDVLVNNAGGVAGQVGRPLEQVSDADWDVIFAINVNAAFTLSRAAAGGMKQQGRGRIVNISSGAGLAASLTGIQAYASAKHAVVGLTRQLAQELGPFGITVNSVAPGLVLSNQATERQWAAYGEDGQRALLQRIALRRLGRAEDIADAVMFFASDRAGFVNGQILSVDGGR